MIRNNRKRRCPQNISYSQLEARNLLAADLYGTAANDSVEVSFVDANTVDIQFNEVLQENVDVSDGLLINLLAGDEDRVWLDSQITADIVIVGAETLELDGGDNQWHLGLNVEGDIQTLTESVAGSVNGNIRFRDVQVIRSGEGVDDFMVNMSENLEVNDADKENFLTVFSGSGDDSFLIYKQPLNAGDQYVGMDFQGEDGDDQFAFYGVAQPTVAGGYGYDTLDYSNARRVSASFGDITGRSTLQEGLQLDEFVWGAGNDLVIAPSTSGDVVSGRSSPEHNYRLDWVIDGNVATVTERNSGESLEYRNFDRFFGDYSGYDQFWVLETAEDLEIFNADWVQIASSKTATEGNLEGIQHDIQISRWLQTIQEGLGPWGQTDSALPIPTDTDGVTEPRVIISDASGGGNVVEFMDENTVRIAGGARLTFTLESQSPVVDLDRFSFKPELIFHGSMVEADYVILENTWTDTTIYSHGGDDVLMFGASNKSTSGTLDEIDGEVHVVSGTGLDRVFVNDHAFEGRSVGHGYRVNGAGVFDIPKFASSTILGRQPYYLKRFADITFDESVDVVRVNGSLTSANEFDVAGNDQLKIVVSGSSDVGDLVRYAGPLDFGIVTEEGGTGSIGFGSEFERIFFYDIERTSNIFAINDTCATPNCDEVVG